MVNIGVLFSLLPPAFCPHVLQGTTPLFLLPSMLDIVSASFLVCFYCFFKWRRRTLFLAVHKARLRPFAVEFVNPIHKKHRGFNPF